jgi:hypothetical protein
VRQEIHAPIAAAVLVLAGSLAVLGTPSDGAACSRDATPGFQYPGASSLVVLAGNRTVSAARNLPRELADAPPLRGYEEQIWRPGQRWWWKARLTRWFKRLRDRPPYGQFAKVEYLGGPDSKRVRKALREGEGEVVLVQWNVTSMCRPALRTERTPALEAGERIFLTGKLRDTTGWVDGRPTFDVTTDHYVYYEREYWKPPTERDARRLGADDVRALYEVLPRFERVQRGDRAYVMAPLRTWMRAHPTLVRRYPAPRMIDNAGTYTRRAAEDRLLRPPTPR